MTDDTGGKHNLNNLGKYKTGEYKNGGVRATV